MLVAILLLCLCRPPLMPSLPCFGVLVSASALRGGAQQQVMPAAILLAPHELLQGVLPLRCVRMKLLCCAALTKKSCNGRDVTSEHVEECVQVSRHNLRGGEIG